MACATARLQRQTLPAQAGPVCTYAVSSGSKELFRAGKLDRRWHERTLTVVQCEASILNIVPSIIYETVQLLTHPANEPAFQTSH